MKWVNDTLISGHVVFNNLVTLVVIEMYERKQLPYKFIMIVALTVIVVLSLFTVSAS
ncbi:hypothetical protein [Furfurilactobacillus entadae]|uniref:hypothetical protein n=1 Tax=Furfurilactobacillus entadae TaxID=2922307 RepID=UPI0038B26EF3